MEQSSTKKPLITQVTNLFAYPTYGTIDISDTIVYIIRGFTKSEAKLYRNSDNRNTNHIDHLVLDLHDT